MIYFYATVLLTALYFLIKEAVAAGVKSALTSEDVQIQLSEAVSRDIEMDRQNTEDHAEKY
jgi:hypothetical protein